MNAVGTGTMRDEFAREDRLLPFRNDTQLRSGGGYRVSACLPARATVHGTLVVRVAALDTSSVVVVLVAGRHCFWVAARVVTRHCNSSDRGLHRPGEDKQQQRDGQRAPHNR